MKPSIKKLLLVLFFLTGGGFPLSIANAAPGDFLYNIGSSYDTAHSGGIAYDGTTGRILVADYYNHRINSFDTSGNPLGYGGSEGTGNSQFKNPSAIAVDGSGKIYIADYVNNRVQVFDSAGNFITKWGSLGTGDGQFDGPSGIAIDSTGKVFVSEVNNNRIQYFDSAGNFLGKWGSAGAGDGQFNQPKGLAIDSADNIYVADDGNVRVQIFDNSSTFIRAFATSGAKDIDVDASGNIYVLYSAAYGRVGIYDNAGNFMRYLASMNPETGTWKVSGLTLDPGGNVYVFDLLANRVRSFQNDGTLLYSWPSVNWGKGQIVNPAGLAVDGVGNLFVSNADSHRIQVFDNHSTFIGQKGSDMGNAQGQFYGPDGIAFDQTGNIYVADKKNHRIQVFNNVGVFQREFGSLGAGDGEFNGPADLAFDSMENLYIADSGNKRLQLYDKNGNFIRNFADLGSIVSYGVPSGVTIDDNDIIYVSIFYHNNLVRYDTAGNRLQDWGANLGYYDFYQLRDVAYDMHGNLYILDDWPNRVTVVDVNGVLVGQIDVPGTPHLSSIASNREGTLIYVGDSGNYVIRVYEGFGPPLP